MDPEPDARSEVRYRTIPYHTAQYPVPLALSLVPFPYLLWTEYRVPATTALPLTLGNTPLQEVPSYLPKYLGCLGKPSLSLP